MSDSHRSRHDENCQKCWLLPCCWKQ
jgi:sulfatase maturation enzyme AslB (radical SAM superfamily)